MHSLQPCQLGNDILLKMVVQTLLDIRGGAPLVHITRNSRRIGGSAGHRSLRSGRCNWSDMGALQDPNVTCLYFRQGLYCKESNFYMRVERYPYPRYRRMQLRNPIPHVSRLMIAGRLKKQDRCYTYNTICGGYR